MDATQQKEQQHSKSKGEQKKENKRPNFFVYNARIAWRFYSTLAQEALLSLVLAGPVYAYLAWTGVTVVTIPVNLATIWGIAFAMFILQSFMFRKGG